MTLKIRLLVFLVAGATICIFATEGKNSADAWFWLGKFSVLGKTYVYFSSSLHERSGLLSVIDTNCKCEFLKKPKRSKRPRDVEFSQGESCT